MSGHLLWGGRFRSSTEEAFAKLNESLSVDFRLWPYDLRSAKAWATVLARCGVLDASEERLLHQGLEDVGRRLESGEWDAADDEDVHTLVERLLYDQIGEPAGKLNTGRSRNDQVATDLRLWCLDAVQSVDAEVAALGQALVMQARQGIDLVLPGYTHGQRAQPVRWAYVLLAHAWPLARDRARLKDVADRASELPLGCGALAGSGIAVDRELLRESLGFRRLSPNGLDATGARDFVAEFLFVLALASTDVSRLGAELLTYASAEYGFVRLSEGYCSGSSLLPQKRNPDVLELTRAKSARVLGDLVGVLTVMRGLPAGYSKDLQEDKGFLFDAVDAFLLTLPAIRGAVAEMTADSGRMEAALDHTLLATDLADRLVSAGVPFREAHGLVGNLVQAAETLGRPLTDVPVETASTIHPELPRAIASLGTWVDSIERRATAGGSSRESVEVQIDHLSREFGLPAG
ncbi:MAG: argininosuccinate lyase [Gemmatimonadota bacterium]|nr:MAG: argininosuccinate lyase [Gemmatimonadota bacterium]